MPNNQTNIIRFDGNYFSYVNDSGNLIKIPAISGRTDSQNSQFQNVVNEGPIPEGFYNVKQSEYRDLFNNVDIIDRIKAIVKFPNWGSERVFLEPQAGTNTFGRDGFNIHGGISVGSAGCIDLVANAPTFFDFFKSLGSDAVLQVDYGSGYNGLTNPLTHGESKITIENIYSNQGKDLSEIKPLQNFLSASKSALEEKLQMSIPEKSLLDVLKNYNFSPSSNLSTFLSKYNLNADLGKYSDLISVFSVKNNLGENLNYSAFLDLKNASQEQQDQWLNQFFETSFFDLKNNVNQFESFLNSQKTSLTDFKLDLSKNLNSQGELQDQMFLINN